LRIGPASQLLQEVQDLPAAFAGSERVDLALGLQRQLDPPFHASPEPRPG